MTHGETKTDSTPEALVSVPRHLFCTKGYAGTTIREIASEAGVNLSLVSYHFDGKEGLYRACIEQFTNARVSDAQRVLQRPASREEFRIRLELFIVEMLGSLGADPELSLLVQREIEQENPIVKDIFDKTLKKVALTLREYLDYGKSHKWARADFDPVIAVSMIFGSMMHSLRMSHVTEKIFNVSIRQEGYRKHYGAQLTSILLDGLTSDLAVPSTKERLHP